MNSNARKIQIFAVLCIACAALLAAYFWPKKKSDTTSSQPASAVAPAAPNAPLRIEKPPAGKPQQILYRYTGIDNNSAHYGKLALANLATPDQPRFIDSLPCESVYFAGGIGICLSAKWGAFPSYSARIFDTDFKERGSIPLQGTPSRSRVSPDGHYGAYTVFLSGHSYASVDFTTDTSLLDMEKGEKIASLEEFQITKDGQPFKAQDFNFWGVTFTPDSKGFYCTLSTARKHYLVKCDIVTRTGTVIHENVECPSLSPDATRIAYKKRLIVDGRLFWQLHVLDLATKTETALSEKRSVDDQLEWLDLGHVLYTMSENPEGSSPSTNVWKADAAGKEPPTLFVPKAYSPAVIR